MDIAKSCLQYPGRETQTCQLFKKSDATFNKLIEDYKEAQRLLETCNYITSIDFAIMNLEKAELMYELEIKVNKIETLMVKINTIDVNIHLSN